MTKSFSRNPIPAVLAVLAFTIGACHSTPDGSKDAAGNDGFVAIFDGKTFSGWKGDTSYWRIDSGTIVGEEKPDRPLKTNSFLIWQGGQPADFEFKAEYRISPEGNSGINYRSEELPDIPYALKGYQADIDGANQYTGQNYEERGRGFLAMRGQRAELPTHGPPVIKDTLGNSDSLKAHIKSNDWNEVYIVVKGNKMTHFINGVLMSEAIDDDTVNRKFKGLLGLQMHVMPSMKVEYRNIRLKQLPSISSYN
ncbi:MAG TPA: DUF1080 domain-containing protein [Puia sp.]